tara:strand:- start:530 stop:784 length:255 start_codon:yes stop_codon:yes gene_type:complete
MIDPKLELYYRNMRELFRTSGWKQLIEDLTNNGVIIDSVELTKNNEDLYFRKGQLDVIANIVNLEGQLESAEQEQLEDTNESIP